MEEYHQFQSITLKKFIRVLKDYKTLLTYLTDENSYNQIRY